eukprot:7263027-Prorocentrum_lima.AAC.1
MPLFFGFATDPFPSALRLRPLPWMGHAASLVCGAVRSDPGSDAPVTLTLTVTLVSNGLSVV